MVTRRQWLIGAGILAAGSLLGCERNESATEIGSLAPVSLDRDAECAVCGMRVAGFPGPKAQLQMTIGKRSRTLFFCSTRDFFAYVRQPELQKRDYPAFVHDMAATPWDKADEAPWIDARQAVYVPSSRLTGAMGATFASFASREAAAQWMQEQGETRLLAFSEVELADVMNMGAGGHHHH